MSLKPGSPHPLGRDWLKHAVIIVILAGELFALYMMLQISVKDNQSFIANPWLPPNPVYPSAEAHPDVDTSGWNWENYREAAPFVLPMVANTVFISTLSAAGTLFLALMAAYFFARHRMPFSTPLWMVFLFLMLMPSIANIVPLFSLLKDLKLLNTLIAVILVHAAAGQAFNIFVLKGFIEEIPRDLFEAAEIDGASHWQQLWNIVLPLVQPVLGTLCILIFVRTWNEYLLPFIILRDKELYPIGVGLIYLDGEYVKQWGLIMAAFVLSSIPLMLLFLFFMKLFVKGVMSGAVKG